MKMLTLTVIVIYFITSTVSQFTDPFSDEGCDVHRSCFRKPEKCDGTNDESIACEMFISWWADSDGESTNFALFGNSEGYIAIGISKTKGMPDTDVYACTSEHKMQRSFNKPGVKANEHKDLIGVSNISVSVEDGYIKCLFTRRQALTPGDETFFDISGDHKYYSLMAIGNNLKPNGDIEIHNVDKESSEEAVSFNKVSQVEVDETTFKLIKAHAAMMVIAWIGFAAPGITVARYLKPCWDDKTLCGGKIWFVVHRFNMVTAVTLTSAAFVCIFVAKGTFISLEVVGTTRFVHAIFGCIIMALSIVNVTMAIFRPHPHEPNRKYYNWAHRTVGLSTLTSSVITMCLGLNINDPFLTNVSHTAFWVLIAFIPFHLVVWLLHEILPKMIVVHKAPDNTDLDMNESKTSVNEPDINQDPPYKYILHTVYTLVVIGVVSYLVTMISSTDP